MLKPPKIKRGRLCPYYMDPFYDGKPHPVYITLQDSQLDIYVSELTSRVIPDDVYVSLRLRWEIPPNVTSQGLQSFFCDSETIALLEKLNEGHKKAKNVDGGFIGTLDFKQYENVCKWITNYNWKTSKVCSAKNYASYVQKGNEFIIKLSNDEFTLKLETSDKELIKISQEIYDEAEWFNVMIHEPSMPYDFLVDLRQKLIDENEDN